MIAVGQSEFSTDNINWTASQNIPIVIDDYYANYPIWNSWGASKREIFFINSNGEYAFSYNVSNGEPNQWAVDITNIDLNGNLVDWQDDHVYKSIIELINWGDGCSNINACNYDQISQYDDSACWFSNENCECSDGQDMCNSLLTEDSEQIWYDFKIEKMYPNPFNPSVEIHFSLPVADYIKLLVYDIKGQEVDVVAEGIHNIGTHNYIWEAIDLPSGVYYFYLNASNMSTIQKALLIK